jgi:HAD superfamily hydrolase (TIGR01549 family)
MAVGLKTSANLVNGVIKAIIFDIDGVLADSRGAVVQNTRELLSEYGFAVETGKIEKMSSAHSAETVLTTLVPSLGADDALLRRMLTRLSKITAKNLHLVRESELARHVPLLSKKYLLAAASNRKTSARMVLEKLGLEQYFKVVVTSADAPPKPDPGMITLALERLGVSASEAVFVGDNKEDELAGKAAGVMTFLLDGTDDAACGKFLGEIGFC